MNPEELQQLLESRKQKIATAFASVYAQQPQNQAQQLAVDFERATSGMDNVQKKMAFDNYAGQLKQYYGENIDAYDNAMQVVSQFEPKIEERGVLGAIKDYGLSATKGLNSGFKSIYDAFDPNGSLSQETAKEIELNQATMSEQARYDQARAEQAIVQAKANGDSGVMAYLKGVKESPVMTLTEGLGQVLPTAAAALATGGTGAVVLGGLQGVGGARGDLYSKIMGTRDSDLLSTSPKYVELRQTLSEQDAKNELGTNFSDHIPEFLFSGATGLITERLGGFGRFGKAGDSALGRLAREVTTEGSDEALQQVASNRAYQRIDPSQSLSEDVALSGVQGAVLGLAGGGVAALDARVQNRNAPVNLIDQALNLQGVQDGAVAQSGFDEANTDGLEGVREQQRYGTDNGTFDEQLSVEQLRPEYSGADVASVSDITLPSSIQRSAAGGLEVEALNDIGKGVSNEVMQRISDAANQAPVDVNTALERAASQYEAPAIRVANYYRNKKVDANQDLSGSNYDAPISNQVEPLFDYDKAESEINDSITNIQSNQKTVDIVSRLRELGGVSLSEHSDLTGESGKVVAKAYPALFRKNAASLHDLVNDGTLNDLLPQGLQIHATDGVPMDTQPAFDYIADALRAGQTKRNLTLEDEYNLRQLNSALGYLREQKTNDISYINRQAQDYQSSANDDAIALQSLQSARVTPQIFEPQKTFAQKNVDAVSQIITGIKKIPLKGKQRTVDVQSIIEKWVNDGQQNLQSAARDNRIVIETDRSRAKQPDNSRDDNQFNREQSSAPSTTSSGIRGIENDGQSVSADTVKYSRRVDDDSLNFARDILTELGQVDEMFKLPVTQATTIQGAMNDLAPEYSYWGEEKLQERPTGAERRHLFGIPSRKGESVKIYEREREVWIDVSHLEQGDGGDAIYNAVADWAYNTGRTFIGDPKGLSPLATRRRTYHMLSQALKHESIDHFEPSNEQLDGDVKHGIVPLRWGNDYAQNLNNLIDTFVTNTYNRNQSLSDYEFDFFTREFRPSVRIESEVGASTGASRPTSARIGGKSPRESRESRAAIWLKSLMGEESSSREGILAKLYRQPQELLSKETEPPNDERVMFTKKPAQNAGFSSSVESVQGELAGVLGFDAKQFRLRLPHVNVVSNADDAGTLSRDTLGNAQAFYDPKTKKITLIADRIREGQAKAVFLHEIFHKRGKELLGDKMPELLQRINKWSSAKDGSIEKETYEAAKARADTSGETGAVYDEELIAYAIEEAVNRGVEIKPNKMADGSAEGFLAYAWRIFTNALKKLMPSYKGKFSGKDLVSIAYGAANLELNNGNAEQDSVVQNTTSIDQDAQIVATYAKESGAPTEAEIRAAQQQIRDVEARYAKEFADGSWRDLTPTGKPSDLTQGQWVQVRTDNFKKWFGDWESNPAESSKVVNKETGEPLVVYHGTTASIDEFSSGLIGNVSMYGKPEGVHFFSDNKMVSDSYTVKSSGDFLTEYKNGGNVGSFFLKLTKPVVVNAKGDNWNDIYMKGQVHSTDSIVNEAVIKNKNDGVVFKNVVDKHKSINGADSPSTTFAVFDDYDLFQSSKIKSAIGNVGTFNNDNNDIRFSLQSNQDVMHFAGTGKSDKIDSVVESIINPFKPKSGKESRSNLKDALLTNFADNLVPVLRWMQKLPLTAKEKQSFEGNMYRAKGVRNALNQEAMDAHGEPLRKAIAALSKKYKMNVEDVKRAVGYWASTRYAPIANAWLIQKDKAVFDAAKTDYQNAVAKGVNANAEKTAMDKAERELNERIADVNSKDLLQSEFKRGVAGGFSDAQAALTKANLEKLIPAADLESAAKHIYDLMSYKQNLDLQSGKLTPEILAKFPNSPYYVPLTGDPRAEEGDDAISGGGGLNVQKDKSIGGRTSSAAEDAIDAAWRALGKSTTFAGWADFKNQTNQMYEDALQVYLDDGFEINEAKAKVEKEYGIRRSGLMGTTRTNDNVLIHKIRGEDVQFELPNAVLEALKNDNKEQLNAVLNFFGTPTRWYARAVTQFYPVFAPINMGRDLWEKSEFIRVKDVYDKDGNKVNTDAVARSMIAKMLSSQWKATFNAARGKFDGEIGSDLKELIDLGGVSTQGTYLARQEKDLINEIKRKNSWSGKTIDAVTGFVEAYNETFDLMPALAAYRSLKEAGVEPKDAAAVTLDLTNFRKTGAKMAAVKALYMFSQPTVTGAVNLSKYLDTRKGKIRFAAYVATMSALYMMLRGLYDDDEGGNKLDEMGDITKFIPIPAGDGKVFKLPVGFGMPQLAWNFATNTMRASVGDIKASDALVNIVGHAGKIFAPVSPSEVPISKYPVVKAILTATPTLLQPWMQVGFDRNAFGSKITPAFVTDKKLKAEQSKSTTAKFWEDTAIEVQRTFGLDVHPEQIKNIVDGYAVGLLRDAVTISVENPNRERLGKETKTPFVNSLYGSAGEYAIQSRFYEAQNEASELKKELESRKSRGDLDGFLTPEVRRKNGMVG